MVWLRKRKKENESWDVRGLEGFFFSLMCCWVLFAKQREKRASEGGLEKVRKVKKGKRSVGDQSKMTCCFLKILMVTMIAFLKNLPLQMCFFPFCVRAWNIQIVCFFCYNTRGYRQDSAVSRMLILEIHRRLPPHAVKVKVSKRGGKRGRKNHSTKQ